jgi:hypothetical protein
LRSWPRTSLACCGAKRPVSAWSATSRPASLTSHHLPWIAESCGNSRQGGARRIYGPNRSNEPNCVISMVVAVPSDGQRPPNRNSGKRGGSHSEKWFCFCAPACSNAVASEYPIGGASTCRTANSGCFAERPLAPSRICRARRVAGRMGSGRRTGQREHLGTAIFRLGDQPVRFRRRLRSRPERWPSCHGGPH